MQENNWLSSLKWAPVPRDEFEKLSREEKLRRIRHSSAHVMAAAVKTIFPSTVFATGPATGTGYFYDVRLNQPIGPEEVQAIQTEIEKICSKRAPFEWTSVSKTEALHYFGQLGQDLKVEIINKIPSETVSLYRNGDFVDLCAGPHVPHTGLCKNSKVLSTSAAHWKKDEVNPSLTRITGTAWTTHDELKEYLVLLEEMKTRDHRVLGPRLELFSFHEWAASAMWHPRGLTLRNELMSLWREAISKLSYVEIYNPLLYRKELFQTSGHWDHFQENLFIIRDQEGDPQFVVKPMNCPDTMLFFKSKSRSYRELPLRIAEGQILHRNETSGALHGIMRTRNFVQDDAHIFLMQEQIQAEIASLMTMLDETYKMFGLSYTVRLSTRPKEFLGSIDVWNSAETSLKQALTQIGQEFTVDEGEGAFYGPKIDVVIRDCLGRQWQCGTVQLDFQLPERFDLTYSAQDGTLKRPIVIHRAIFGSFERFIGILIEHFGGAFPTWLAPLQVVVMPINDGVLDYAQGIVNRLQSAKFRTSLEASESINYRIRNAESQKVPYMIVVGGKEKEAQTVTIRRYGTKQQSVATLDELVAMLQDTVSNRKLDVQIKTFSALFAETKSTEAEPY